MTILIGLVALGFAVSAFAFAVTAAVREIRKGL